MVTIILGSVVVVGYIVIMFTMAVTEIPTAINQVKDEFKLAHRKRRFVEGKTFWDIWGTNILAASCSLGFCLLHWINFDFFPEFYTAIVVFINAPMLMNTTRAYVTSYPKNKNCRNFAIVYDCIFVKSFFRNYAVLCTFCLLVKYTKQQLQQTLCLCVCVLVYSACNSWVL
jgi:sulfur relay (sulfurtransferase) DsrC/TusE family protein